MHKRKTLTVGQLKAISKRRSRHIAPSEVPTSSLSELNECSAYYAVVDIIYSINTNRLAGEPLMRIRQTEMYERDKGCGPFEIGLYDCGKDIPGTRMYCRSIADARGFALGVLATRRFRKNMETSA